MSKKFFVARAVLNFKGYLIWAEPHVAGQVMSRHATRDEAEEAAAKANSRYSGTVPVYCVGEGQLKTGGLV